MQIVLPQYQALGNKPTEELVKRYLDEVVHDCGEENRQIAELVLLLLTDEKGIRPLKTRDELMKELEPLVTSLETARASLDLVLPIFIGSGLVLLLPEIPEDRYQLVHDYLATFIRYQQESKLNVPSADLEKEIAKRKQSEEKLERIEQANKLLTEAQQQAKFKVSEQNLSKKGSWINRQVLTIAIVVAGSIVGLRSASLLEGIELFSLDYLLKSRPLEPIDRRVVIVGINEQDLKAIGKYPVPNQNLADALKVLQTAKPRAIGLDLFRDLTQTSDRAALAEVFTNSHNIIGIESVLGEQALLTVKPPPELPPERVGIVDAILDADGKLRRGLLASKVDSGEIKYSMVLRLAALYLQSEGIVFKHGPRASDPIYFGSLALPRFESNTGGYVGAAAGGNQILLNFRSNPKPFRILSLMDVLNRKFKSDWIRDRIVLIGMTATSVNDSFMTSATQGTILSDALSSSDQYQITYGVEYQAHAISQLINAVLEGRPLIRVFNALVEGLLLFIGAYLTAGVVWRLKSPVKTLIVLLTVGIGLTVIAYLAILLGWWLPLVPILLVATGSGTFALVWSISHHSNQSRKIYLQTLIRLQDAYHIDPFVGGLAIEFFMRSITDKEIADQAAVFLTRQRNLSD